MELKEFIKNTISSISLAIIESQNELKDNGVIVNPEKYEIDNNGAKKFGSFSNRYIQTLEFDVSVGIESESGGSGGAKLKVASLLNVGGERSQKKSNEIQNRIRFEIPVAFSTVETPDGYDNPVVLF